MGFHKVSVDPMAGIRNLYADDGRDPNNLTDSSIYQPVAGEDPLLMSDPGPLYKIIDPLPPN
jgi:hypothetical protein